MILKLSNMNVFMFVVYVGSVGLGYSYKISWLLVNNIILVEKR